MTEPQENAISASSLPASDAAKPAPRKRAPRKAVAAKPTPEQPELILEAVKPVKATKVAKEVATAAKVAKATKVAKTPVPRAPRKKALKITETEAEATPVQVAELIESDAVEATKPAEPAIIPEAVPIAETPAPAPVAAPPRVTTSSSIRSKSPEYAHLHPPERPQRFDRPERGERGDRGERGERSERGERVEREERPPAEPVFSEGVLEISGKGFGFLREAKRNFQQSPQDVFVTPEIVRRYSLRDGLSVYGEIRRGGRGPQLISLLKINGEDPERYRDVPLFEELTTINPCEWIRMETTPDRFTTRVVDMMAPIGKGQRGLIVAPPRTGKTTLLQHIADAVVQNHPDMKLMILLVDERPEEVTEIRRAVPKAEIMASSNDSDVKSHTRIAQLAIERAKRLVEAGHDVFILLDSMTRVGRAFNNANNGSGRTLSGGMDARGMEIPRRLFAAARNTEEAGSLTIIATALVETGSRMDELIFQEFKGTGNMELMLDRRISDQRIYPAVDIGRSGTRREELLLPMQQLEKISVIRRGLSGHKPIEAIERLISFLRKFPTNEQLLKEIPNQQ